VVDMAWKSKNLIVVSWLLVTKRVPDGSRVMLEMGFVCAGIMSSWERGYSSSSSELSSESESESCGGLALGGGGAAARRVCSTRAFTSRSIVCFPKDFGRKARIGSSGARSGSSIVGSLLSPPAYSSSPGIGFSDIVASYRSMYRVGVV